MDLAACHVKFLSCSKFFGSSSCQRSRRWARRFLEVSVLWRSLRRSVRLCHSHQRRSPGRGRILVEMFPVRAQISQLQSFWQGLKSNLLTLGHGFNELALTWSTIASPILQTRLSATSRFESLLLALGQFQRSVNGPALFKTFLINKELPFYKLLLWTDELLQFLNLANGLTGVLYFTAWAVKALGNNDCVASSGLSPMSIKIHVLKTRLSIYTKSLFIGSGLGLVILSSLGLLTLVSSWEKQFLLQHQLICGASIGEPRSCQFW